MRRPPNEPVPVRSLPPADAALDSTGPTWVLLRGLAREAGHWGDFIERFADVEPGSAVVALDLPGAGRRHRERASLDVPDMVRRVQAEARQLGLHGNLRLFGLSLGGMVAAQWALQSPEEVTHCVVVNSSMRPLAPLRWRLRPVPAARLLGALVSGDARALERRVLEVTSARAHAGGAVVDDWVRLRTLRPVSTLDTLRQLVAAARYRLPASPPSARTLVLCSAGDALVDPRCSVALAAHWRCGLRRHAWAGHDLPLDDAAWVVEQVREWRAARPADAGPASEAW